MPHFVCHAGDIITDIGGGPDDLDTLTFFQDIAPEDVTAIRMSDNPDDLILVLRGGGQITLVDELATTGAGIEQITFLDGTVWSLVEIAALSQSAAMLGAPPPTAYNDTGLIYGGTDNVLLSAPLLANDIDPSGGPLTLQSVSNVSVGTALVNAEGNIALNLPAGYEGKVTFLYTIANAAGVTATAMAEVTIVPNAAPVAASTIIDQTATPGEPWQFALPAGLFSDTDGDPLAYFATQADGSELPAWLSFNAATATFSGTPPANAGLPIEIRVEAYDGFVISDLTFTLSSATPPPDPDQTIPGTSGDDVLVGGSGNDTFTVDGNSTGFDVFHGNAGTDRILGSAFNDTFGLANVAGNLDGIEIIDGGAGYDTIRLTTGNDSLDLSGITVAGIELIDGGTGNDTLTGSATTDVIRGNAGDDIISGGAGNDTFAILGNAEGFDVFNGGTGTDTILGSAFNDTIGLANLAGNLDGIEAIEGGAGYDTIRLTDGNDSLDLSGITLTGIELIDAGAGNDYITASAAHDVLKGGSGNDTFVFRDGFGHDTIVDFEIGSGAAHDVIDFTEAGFADFNAVLAAASQVGSDTVITIDQDQQLTLAGITLQQLTADHFHIV